MFKVLTSSSIHKDTLSALKEVAADVAGDAPQAVFLFVSPEYDLDILGPAIPEHFSCPVISCTTAGELVRGEGYLTGSMVAASISSDRIAICTRLLTPASGFHFEDAKKLADSIWNECSLSPLEHAEVFGFLLTDAMSCSEERVTAALYHALGGIPMVGASAGDDLRLKATHVYHDGKYHTDAAQFTLVRTTLPFTVFQTQNFTATDKKLVITEATPENRVVQEINGYPAARAYADAVGVKLEELTPDVFSRHPVIVRIGGVNHVRGIRKINDDESLSFYCAVDVGIVLSLGKCEDLIEDLSTTLHDLKKKIPNPGLLLCCDCIHRKLLMQQDGITREVEAQLAQFPYVGFSTYGEQLGSIHMNQTLTGVLIGADE